MNSFLHRLAHEMQSDLDWYFENANEDSKRNVLIFRRQIERVYGNLRGSPQVWG
jgi:hypothetical protein